MSRLSQGLVGDGNAPAAIADHAITFTTDDPGQTAADTTVIADGDGTIVLAEMLQMGEDISAKLNLVLAALRAAGVIKT